ncbi:alpha/beta hydrolase [Corynebacterium gerontici]|uniref:Alpha/beta hydrolase family protein n=1 Tax=Corynebacterium gerontici TaxID=2079234 RepID=A0A3G6J165_9CORY|nr:alpha/beta hydrolase [Corynebacterium gerontici]AZA11666.1 Alpha/beta hydrolase family protein [Corynebacterium gerontici]
MSNSGNHSTPHHLDWQPDALGDDFEASTLHLGTDPDGEGDVAAVLVRYQPACSDWQQRPALLFIHGMTDYFFHQHIAHHFHEEGYAVYGIDLRKSGRAHIAGQRWHYVSDLRLYFQELNAVAFFLADDHPALVPVAHSTGGLIAALWLDELNREKPEFADAIAGLILNSPWLDMQFPTPLVKGLRALLHSRAGHALLRKGIGGRLPSNYGRSLHASAEGEWDYDLSLKPIRGHKKYPEWLKTVDSSQRRIHEGAVDVEKPVLTLHARRSFLKPRYAEAAKTADTVLDVEQISRRAPLLGQDVTVVAIDNAVHDVFLSQPQPREEAIKACLNWLKKTLPA